MKAVLTTSRRPLFPVNFEVIRFACLLSLASALAIIGGMASSMLFFGLLLAFSLLLLVTRYFSSTTEQRVTRLRP